MWILALGIGFLLLTAFSITTFLDTIARDHFTQRLNPGPDLHPALTLLFAILPRARDGLLLLIDRLVQAFEKDPVILQAGHRQTATVGELLGVILPIAQQLGVALLGSQQPLLQIAQPLCRFTLAVDRDVDD